MIKENLVMFTESLAEFKQTGCVCSTSRTAAKAMVAPLHLKQGPRKILEVGAGTGAVTLPLIESMQPEDTLVVCELSSRLMKTLKARLENFEPYLKNKDRIEFFEGPIQNYREETTFDFLVCALPFLNFELELLDDIFQKFLRLSHKDTYMTYFEYIGIRPISKVLSPAKRKKRMNEIDGYLGKEYKPRTVNIERVWWNISPINVYTLHMAA
ncbi:MAG: methyltransferase domain-containing protein [Bdellovibrionales bacterium]|nr:methyltransferase domain-containing protein [Bdellovibrionales bacterium]